MPTNIRFRDGSYSNFNNTDLNGNAGFNEIFPLFNWYVIETDSTRYKNTGTHVVYDAGGPADGTPCGACKPRRHLRELRHRREHGQYRRADPGARCSCGCRARVYCLTRTAPTRDRGDSIAGDDCRLDRPRRSSLGHAARAGRASRARTHSSSSARSRSCRGENGGIHGEVIYASTRPFDDPTLLIHTSWTPDVPGVTINLYQEGTAADGTTSLTLVDTTTTTSWDDWAQGFRSDGVPNMNCPGQATTDLFYLHAAEPAEVPRRVQQPARRYGPAHDAGKLPVQVL